MSDIANNQKTILAKLGIEKLNRMQEQAIKTIHSKSNVVLLSPTGTGKTLAFLLPLIASLDTNCSEVQLLIIVPSRELALQIEQVARSIGSGFKCNAVYGGRAGSQDKIDLKHRPAILIGTPGRVADHLRKDRFATNCIQTLVLDEYDKSLEIGFEKEMKEISKALKNLKTRILTSATQGLELPEFVGMTDAVYIDYLHESISKLKQKCIVSPSKNKLDTLVKTLCHLGNQPGIVFCSFKDAIQEVSEYLDKNNIKHGCFYGDMEQNDRELALVKFRNGTHQLLVATDLAARGIDIPELKFIIHYQLPSRNEEFTHRNGRTARMNSNGTAYILKWEQLDLPPFITETEVEEITTGSLPKPSNISTLHITGGRRDKISKGDIAGLFLKQAKLNMEELGLIEIKQDCAFVAVPTNKLAAIIAATNNSKLKKKKVRVSEI
jgi:superfamily II DNA/RNA helicase